jgi:competence protein ComEC
MRLAGWVVPGCLAGVVAGVIVADPARPMPAAATVICLLAATAGILALAASSASAGHHRLRLATILLGAVSLGFAAGTWRAEGAALPTGPGTVAAAARTGREVTIAGTAVDDPRPREDRQQVVLESVTLDGRAARGKLLAWLPRAVEVVTGDRLTFKARLEQPEDSDGFAYRAYLARQGIGAIARAFAANVVSHPVAGPAELASRLRGSLLGGLDRIVPEPEAALGAGILLGVRTSIDPDVSASFATAGLTHVVAISGWNIAIVAALVARLLDGLRRRRGGRLGVPALTIGAIAGYVVLVGASPSVVRAALMAAALLLGRQAGSRAHAASALMLAALAMVLVAPPVIWDVGFQLSLFATAGLIAFGATLDSAIASWPGWLREPVALTTAAQLATLPIILATFERFSLVAPLANVVVVPLVPLVMLASAIAAPIGAVDAAVHIPLLGDAATWLAGGSAWLGLRAMIATGSTAASIPFAALPIAAPAWLPALWYPALAIGWRVASVRGRRAVERSTAPVALAPIVPRRRSGMVRLILVSVGRLVAHALASLATPRRAVAALVAVLGLSTVATLPDGRLHLVMLDVGQGDGILVVAPSGASLLIDGGPDSDLTLRRLGSALPWWRREIDTLILTHPHQDHVGGLPDVLRRFRVTTVLDSGRAYANPTYDRFLALTRSEPGAIYRQPRAGEVLRIDAQTNLEIWFPSSADAAAPLLEADINNASIVGLLTFGRFSALLTGDAKSSVEALLASRGLLRPVDVLKVGHHGSNFSTSPPLLTALRPTSALISVGQGNPYGHPGQTTLRALASAGVQVLRTDRDGTVEVLTDGATWTVRTQGRTGPAHAARGRANAVVGGKRPDGLPPPGTTSAPAAGSIAGWPFLIVTRPGGSSRGGGCRPRSSCIRKGSRVSPQLPRGWSRTPASRSTWASSRPPPCSTTSTRSSIPTEPNTARPAHGCSRRWDSGTSRCPSRRTPSPPSSTTSATPAAGPPCWSA